MKTNKYTNCQNKLLSQGKFFLQSLLSLSVALVATNLPAQAASFNFTYQSGTITKKQIEGVELAGSIWSSYLQDSDVEINVHFEMTNGLLPNGKLGGATPYIVKMNYDLFKQGLAADGTADINLLPTSNLGSDKYSVMLENGQVDSNYYEILQTSANNKALGNDISGDASGLDLYIQIESSANWSYSYFDGYTPGDKYDFLSVVLHELGHGLGFISGIDADDGEIDELPSALDMFRYSSQSANQGAIDFGVGGSKYFSTDGGQTQLGEFSTGVDTSNGGDGDQASHWKASAQPYLGIMSSTIEKGETRYISPLDLTAFDYIGWDVNHSAQLDFWDLLQLKLGAYNKANDIWGNSNYILDRSSDVESMIEDSGIYNWGWNPFWQEEANYSQAQAVPEGSTNGGLLGIISLAALSLVKRFQPRKFDE